MALFSDGGSQLLQTLAFKILFFKLRLSQ